MNCSILQAEKQAHDATQNQLQPTHTQVPSQERLAEDPRECLKIQLQFTFLKVVCFSQVFSCFTYGMYSIGSELCVLALADNCPQITYSNLYLLVLGLLIAGTESSTILWTNKLLRPGTSDSHSTITKICIRSGHKVMSSPPDTTREQILQRRGVFFPPSVHIKYIL